MRVVGDLAVDEEGYMYFRITTTQGWTPGRNKLCRVAGGMVYFWDDYIGIERGFPIGEFVECLHEVDSEISGTGEAER